MHWTWSLKIFLENPNVAVSSLSYCINNSSWSFDMLIIAYNRLFNIFSLDILSQSMSVIWNYVNLLPSEYCIHSMPTPHDATEVWRLLPQDICKSSKIYLLYKIQTSCSQASFFPNNSPIPFLHSSSLIGVSIAYPCQN